MNISIGERVIQESLMDIFLNTNAAPLTAKRNESIDEKSRIRKKVDTLEERILAALSETTTTATTTRTDNELGAIGMLAEVHYLSERYTTISGDLIRIEVWFFCCHVMLIFGFRHNSPNFVKAFSTWSSMALDSSTSR